jgi:hypothetical protein
LSGDKDFFGFFLIFAVQILHIIGGCSCTNIDLSWPMSSPGPCPRRNLPSWLVLHTVARLSEGLDRFSVNRNQHALRTSINTFYKPSSWLSARAQREMCCWSKIMSCQSDFVNERPLLQQIIEDAGHVCLFLPKFLCELNPIELFWSYIKDSKLLILPDGMSSWMQK